MRRAAICLLLLIVSAPAWAAIAVGGKASCSGSTAALGCTMSVTPTNGSTLWACVGRKTAGASESVTSISQTGATWVKLAGPTFQNPTLSEVWYAANVSGASTSVTINMNVSRASAAVILELTGARTLNPLDADTAIDQSATGTAVGSGTISSASFDQGANALLGCLASANQGGTAAFSGQTSPYVEEGDTGVASNIHVAAERKIVSAAEDATVSANVSSSQPWIGRMTIVKEQPATQTLTISKGGAGKGRVVTSPAGVSCGATCNYAYDQDQVVAMTAEPVFDSTFSGWSGDADCSDASVTMSVAVGCTATFALKTYYTLTITKNGTGTGLVRSSGKEIECGATCASSYVESSTEWLNAYPDAGSVFAGWSGTGCPTTAVGGMVTMNAARTCTATFNLESGASVLYHVRSDGNDACDGLSDAACSSGAGSFQHVQKGIDSINCTNGDDVRVHGAVTYSEAVSSKTGGCICPGRDDATNGPCIVQGDGATSIIDPGAGLSALQLGGTTGANRASNFIIRDMRMKGGTVSAFGGASKYVTDTTLLDLTLTDFAQFGPKVQPPDSAIIFDAAFSSDDNNVVDGVIIDGDETSCAVWLNPNGTKFCGTRYANGIYAGGTRGGDFRNLTIRDLRGAYGRFGSDNTIQDFVFSFIWCSDEAHDDACGQLYNAGGVVFRRGLMESVHANGSAGTQAYATIKTRRTAVCGCGGSPPSCTDPCGSPAGVTVYGVTFAGEETGCSGDPNGCAANSWGTNSNLRRHALENVRDGSNDQYVYDDMYSVRNIFQHLTGGGSTVSLYTADDPNSSNASVCPPTAAWRGDIFFDVDNGPNSSTCTVTKAGYDASYSSVSPGLDASFTPTTWAEACFPQGSSFTAPDGDVADGWVGKYAGACAAITSGCTNLVKDGAETDVDCGGGTCPLCADGKACAVNGDCQSNNCVSLVCAAAVPPGGSRMLQIVITEALDNPAAPYIACMRSPMEDRFDLPDPPPGFAFWWVEVAP